MFCVDEWDWAPCLTPRFGYASDYLSKGSILIRFMHSFLRKARKQSNWRKNKF